ncbi:MAG: hypothetical protein ABI584_04010 [Acidobacteriota bacterium]
MNRTRTLVLAALTVVVVLAGTLVWRLVGRRPAVAHEALPLPRFTGTAPLAHGPAPKPIVVAALKPPCWGCPEADKWPVRYQTDLDLLAPLGDGAGNTALWLKDFAKPSGARLVEGEEAMKRRAEGPDGSVLPPDDPLLKEAERWADQATMRFYPDVWKMAGFSTPLPNLLVAITIARSWVGRARLNPDAPEALEDCRRAIRWGRLLRQEDATFIQDLIGSACIRSGAQGLYEIAARRGDTPLMLAAAIVLGEHAPQRLRTAEMLTRLRVLDEAFHYKADDSAMKNILDVAQVGADRRYRLEAIGQLALVRARGPRAHRAKATEALDALAASPDPLIAAEASWALTFTESDVGR